MAVEKRAALIDDLVAALAGAGDTHKIDVAIKAVFVGVDEENN
ncbi:hypothetical protein [Rhodococcus sp. OK302]|nr:hypothetical protein [Rhodococcus sp. OK302]